MVLDFDHLPGVDKKFEISRAVNASTRSWARIEKEIPKCEVVCANCHRRRTSARAGHRKHLLKMGLPLPTPPDLSTRRAQTPHGGGAKGRRGCSCEPCRRQRSEYARQWRAKQQTRHESGDVPLGETVANLESDPQ